MFTLAKDRTKKGAELRDVMVDSIEQAMAVDERVVALEADLGGASHFTNIAKKYPERFIQCGIAEANMIGVAAGMSSEGYHPFTHTFGPFSTRRVFDQIFLSGAYAHNTLNIFGSDPGFCVGTNGGTHTTWEDMALMRTIPGAVVCDAADETQMRWIVAEFAKLEGIHYIRANRKAVRTVYESGSTFELGKGNLLREGSDVLIVACGQLVSEALDAAEALEAEGVSCSVVDMFCVKPLDEELVLSEAAGKKLVVTFENHGVIGGLGDAVAATLAEAGAGVKLVRHGVKERFGQVGDPAWLQKDFHLTADDLVASVKGGLA
ncbi:transketolase family protein [Olsenella profusa]|uniref:Alpha-ketoacid dehydrogenase subunit beta n=1 Tax=Olsenella profusa TaxID=138595 RepID=A0ABS2F0C9_9ACTN|nr:alpha-ketoacid dehydrogenase subunit beta [Olsenella profusa]